MELKRLLSALLRKWWLIAILAIIGGGFGAYVVYSNSVSVYSANASLYIMNRDKVQQAGQTLDSSDLNLSRQIVQDYSQIIQSRMVTSEVVRRLKTSYISESYINSVVSVGMQDGSNILTISVEDTDPQMAMNIANTTSMVFVEKMNELTNSNNVGILDKAQLPGDPIPTNSGQKIPLGVIAGIAIGVAAIYIKESFDTTIRSVEEVESGLELQVIGIIPEHAIK